MSFMRGPGSPALTVVFTAEKFHFQCLKITECQALGTDFLGRAPVFKCIFTVTACGLRLTGVSIPPNSQHARVYDKAAQFHHKLKLGTQTSSLKQTFSSGKTISL